MVIERLSTLKLVDVEPNLRNAAQRMGATVVHRELVNGAAVFSIAHPVLYERLLSTEMRFAVFLPCRVAAFEYRGGLKLIVMSPVQFARDLHHPEVATAAAALENVLVEILVDLEHFASTEEQMDMRDTVAQRIDSHGSKIEDLAGTGEQDSRGG